MHTIVEWESHTKATKTHKKKTLHTTIPLTKTISYKIVFQVKFRRIKQNKETITYVRYESQCVALFFYSSSFSCFCHSVRTFFFLHSVIVYCECLRLRFISLRFICFKRILLFVLYQKDFSTSFRISRVNKIQNKVLKKKVKRIKSCIKLEFHMGYPVQECCRIIILLSILLMKKKRAHSFVRSLHFKCRVSKRSRAFRDANYRNLGHH